MKPILEVCCPDTESVNAAKTGGADRIELCSSLETGGLTPSAALIDYAVRLMPERVNVLIRPRAGDFLYSPEEIDTILNDIDFAVRHGAAGIVCGALTADGRLDTDVLRLMLEATGAASFTLHRAFDMCRNPHDALEEAVRLGIDRILTSGLSSDVMTGCGMLSELHNAAAGRIIIMAGGGVSRDNATTLMQTTGIRELHASCKVNRKSGMTFRRDSVSMSTPGSDEFSYPATSAETVSLLAHTIHNFQP